VKITQMTALDVRFPMPPGAGSDSLHVDPLYSFATCKLRTDDGLEGTGITFTLGRGNEVVTAAIRAFWPFVRGHDVAELAADLGARWRAWANESQLRWLGPHKGAIHLGLAAVTGAIVDLWARSEGKPLWRLLLDLSPEQLVALADFSTISDVIDEAGALELLRERRLPEAEIAAQLERGYPGYDTSVGWLGYSRDQLVTNALSSVGRGFRAVKLKVGSPDIATDADRVAAVREAVGPEILVMVDANQCWSVPRAIEAGRALASSDVFWFEEPVHPDDVLGYRDVATALAPMRIAGGEHVPNQVVFKNFIRAGAIQVAQPDVVRLGGLPEFLGVALMAAEAGIPVLPHAGETSQIHQHLILFTRCVLGLPELPLETIPHLAEHFVDPVQIVKGRYRPPTVPGIGAALQPDSLARHAATTEVLT